MLCSCLPSTLLRECSYTTIARSNKLPSMHTNVEIMDLVFIFNFLPCLLLSRIHIEVMQEQLSKTILYLLCTKVWLCSIDEGIDMTWPDQAIVEIPWFGSKSRQPGIRLSGCRTPANWPYNHEAIGKKGWAFLLPTVTPEVFLLQLDDQGV